MDVGTEFGARGQTANVQRHVRRSVRRIVQDDPLIPSAAVGRPSPYGLANTYARRADAAEHKREQAGHVTSWVTPAALIAEA
jgi:hypothetical protein